MSKIRYAVIGIDNQMLSNLIGTLARGELEGRADIVVLPALVPQVYSVKTTESGTFIKPVSFEAFLTDAVSKEREKLAKEGPGEKLLKEATNKILTMGKG
jgi:hypothetical protein